MDRLATVPNVLTLSRLAAAPVLVLAAALDRDRLFLGLLLAALATDVVDGPIARATGQATDRGAMFDSVADAALYAAAPLGVALLKPWVLTGHPWLVVAIFAAWAAPIAVGAVRFGRLTSYHTVAARVSGSALAAGGLVLLLTDALWPLRVAAAGLLLSAIEEIAISCVLPHWRPNVPSFSAALRLARPQRDSTAPPPR
jgi:CDP-diacylglycerol--glycerol-3-phosphate 3-phosphatidyltransferase